MTVGERIKKLRKQNKMTQQELANYLEVSKVTVQKYENGSIKNLKIEHIRRLCKLFKVAPILFIYDNMEYAHGAHMHSFIDNIYGRNFANLLAYYEKLSPEGQAKLVDYAEDLIKIYKQE